MHPVKNSSQQYLFLTIVFNCFINLKIVEKYLCRDYDPFWRFWNMLVVLGINIGSIPTNTVQNTTILSSLETALSNDIYISFGHVEGRWVCCLMQFFFNAGQKLKLSSIL